MLTVTNDTRDFIKNKTGELLIYGCGNSGYWIGYYLNRCQIEFSGYIDQNEAYRESFCNGKPVYLPEILEKYRDRSIRLIISPAVYESVLAELLFLVNRYGFHALCLVPRYKRFNDGKKTYDINHFLGYFRRKLYKGDTPTIISNDCTAGLIYYMMDMLMLSPTINVAIDAMDFLKLCGNPKRYFNVKAAGTFFNVWPAVSANEDKGLNRGVPSIKIDDITVGFAHSGSSVTELADRWNMMCRHINWHNMVYIMRVNQRYVSKEIIQEFSKLSGKKLIINLDANGIVSQDVEQIFLDRQLMSNERAIENGFDLLGWLNKDLGNCETR